jgi:hypothetical protein
MAAFLELDAFSFGITRWAVLKTTGGSFPRRASCQAQ